MVIRVIGSCSSLVSIRRGFTLIELLVVLAIVSLLLTLAAPRYFKSLDASKETVLVDNLRIVRETIDKFYGDNGRYPDSLDELVEARYLRSKPFDPFTESTETWTLSPPPNGAAGRLFDIRSGAEGATRDGRPFKSL